MPSCGMPNNAIIGADKDSAGAPFANAYLVAKGVVASIESFFIVDDEFFEVDRDDALLDLC